MKMDRKKGMVLDFLDDCFPDLSIQNGLRLTSVDFEHHGDRRTNMFLISVDGVVEKDISPMFSLTQPPHCRSSRRVAETRFFTKRPCVAWKLRTEMDHHISVIL